MVEVNFGSFGLGLNLNGLLVPVRVRINVKLAKFLQFFDFFHERGPCGNHCILGFCGHNITILNGLFGLPNLVKLLLLVSELLALCVQENVVDCGKVDGELTLLFWDACVCC